MSHGLDERLSTRLQQLRSKFEDNDEARHAQALVQHHEDLQHAAAADEVRVNSIIEGLRYRVEEAEVAATPPDPSIHAADVINLQTSCRESTARITSLENDIRDLEDQREDIRRRRSAAEEQGAEAARVLRAEDPELRGVLTSLAIVSRIDWDKNSKGLQGKVVDQEQQDVRAFDLTSINQSDFETVNRLWDIIG